MGQEALTLSGIVDLPSHTSISDSPLKVESQPEVGLIISSNLSQNDMVRRKWRFPLASHV